MPETCPVPAARNRLAAAPAGFGAARPLVKVSRSQSTAKVWYCSSVDSLDLTSLFSSAGPAPWWRQMASLRRAGNRWCIRVATAGSVLHGLPASNLLSPGIPLAQASKCHTPYAQRANPIWWSMLRAMPLGDGGAPSPKPGSHASP